MEYLESKTYDDMAIGDEGTLERTITEKDILMFAAVSGDVNPVHVDAEYAKGSMFGEQIAHGMLSGGLVSTALAMVLPGPGTIYAGQTLRFKAPVKIGDHLKVTVKITAKEKRGKRDTPFITLDCAVTNQDDVVVASGEAEVVAPSEKMRIAKPPMPVVTVEKRS